MKSSRDTGKKMTIFLHTLAWVIILLIPFYIFNSESHPRAFHFSRFYLQSGIFLILFYLNFFWLVPKIWLNGKKLRFILISGGLILFFLAVLFIIDQYGFQPRMQTLLAGQPEMINGQVNNRPPGPKVSLYLYNYLFTSILISGFCVGLRVSEQLSENEKKRKELEKEKLNSELALLKNQISPHFFFNTLNNIYSLIAINTDDAQSSVLKLSKLMRYLLYESERGQIHLSKEIEFMNHYIDLMKLRISEKVRLNVSFPIEYKDFSLPPLLFIPFVENAFKHGVSYRESSYIRIMLETDDQGLVFSCRNSVGSSRMEASSNEPGIGLENVRKRLNLLFPGSHKLTITEQNHEFEVHLNIRLTDYQA